MPKVVNIYRSSRAWATSLPSWKGDAACKGMQPELFEIDEPIEGLPEGQAPDVEELISWGLKVCAGCPVRKICDETANEEDRYWTTRGGRPPEGLFPDSKPPKARLERERKPKKVCKRGHDNWKTRPSGKRRCVTCDREVGARRRARDKAAAAG